MSDSHFLRIGENGAILAYVVQKGDAPTLAVDLPGSFFHVDVTDLFPFPWDQAKPSKVDALAKNKVAIKATLAALKVAAIS